MSPPYISIVSPVYRAENCISELCRRLKVALTPITENFEILLVEDRSPDNCLRHLRILVFAEFGSPKTSGNIVQLPQGLILRGVIGLS